MWNATLYKEQHAFVFEYGNDLLSWLDPKEGEHILDVGCGTGELTAKIAEPGAIVTGIDQSPEMIESARSHYPELRFEVADITELSLGQEYDAIFSNATLHWVLEKEKAAAQMRRHLKPGGRLVLEMGGLNNVKSLSDAVSKELLKSNYAFPPVWYFPSAARYTTVLEHQGLTIRKVMYFDRETELKDGENGIVEWLEMFGGHFFVNVPPAEKQRIMYTVQENLRPTHFRDGKWFLDYKRLRIHAERPASH